MCRLPGDRVETAPDLGVTRLENEIRILVLVWLLDHELVALHLVLGSPTESQDSLVTRVVDQYRASMNDCVSDHAL
jgi:hypothetical protein